MYCTKQSYSDDFLQVCLKEEHQSSNVGMGERQNVLPPTEIGKFVR